MVIGETQTDPAKVFKTKAKQTKSKIVFADKKIKVNLVKSNLTHSWFQVKSKSLNTTLKVNLHGEYQAKNLTTVLQSLEFVENHFPLKLSKIKTAFSDLKALTNFKGRWQLLDEKPFIICDSAHNEAGLQLAMQQLDQAKKNYKKILTLDPSSTLATTVKKRLAKLSD